nr:ribonuclease H-like domain-containing protein [Tanacetum cinerariifolium]
MDQQNPTFAKILILDIGKFEQWQFRIQQYLQHEHYALWEVIEFGDSYEALKEDAATTSDGSTKKKGRTITFNTKDMQKRKNDVKARTTLLLSLPDEHQLRFSKHKTAQELWAAILKTFGEIEHDDLNKKFLTNLAPEWLMHMIVWRNMSDLDTMSLDDLYNHLKVYKSDVEKKSESNSQNIAFISSAKHISRNEEVNTASVSTASTNDINHIDKDDMEEMDIKWNMALLSMRVDRFWKKTGKKISIQGINVAGFDKSMVECFNCHKMGHFARQCKAPRSQDRGRRDNYRQGSKVEEQTPKALMAIDGVGWDWRFMANEQEDHALVSDEEASTEFALMAKTSAKSKVFDNSLCSKNCKKNTESLNSKIAYLTDKLSDSKNMLFRYKAGILKFADDTVTDYSRPSPAIESTSYDVQNRNSYETEASSSTISSKPFIKFVKATVRPTKNKTVNVKSIKKPVVKYAEKYRKPSKKSIVRGNQRNWNNLKSQQLGVKKRRSCPKNNCSNKSMTPKAVIHKPYRPPMRPVRPNVNVAQTKRTSFHKLAHSYSKRHFQRTSTVRKFPTGNTKFSTADMGKRGNTGSSQNISDDKGYWDSGCSRHMTGNISYLSDYELFDGGYVSFGQGGCKITGKGIIKIGKLEFENVYFVKDIKYNLFSVSQICDNKNSVLFTDSECIMLGRNFKLTDDTNVLLRTLKHHNMYSIDLNNIVPHKDLTCLVAKASA